MILHLPIGSLCHCLNGSSRDWSYTNFDVNVNKARAAYEGGNLGTLSLKGRFVASEEDNEEELQKCLMRTAMLAAATPM